MQKTPLLMSGKGNNVITPLLMSGWEWKQPY